jgi:hypothetical protein
MCAGADQMRTSYAVALRAQTPLNGACSNDGCSSRGGGRGRCLESSAGVVNLDVLTPLEGQSRGRSNPPRFCISQSSQGPAEGTSSRDGGRIGGTSDIGRYKHPSAPNGGGGETSQANSIWLVQPNSPMRSTEPVLLQAGRGEVETCR